MPGVRRQKIEFPEKGWNKSGLSWSDATSCLPETNPWIETARHRCLVPSWTVNFLTRLLTSGEEDFERVSVLKENTSSTACELTMFILSISVSFSATSLTVASLVTKSCQQCWPIYTFLFILQGGSRLNTAIMFGVEKQNVYPMEEKFGRYVYSFGQNTRTKVDPGGWIWGPSRGPGRRKSIDSLKLRPCITFCANYDLQQMQ